MGQLAVNCASEHLAGPNFRYSHTHNLAPVHQHAILQPFVWDYPGEPVSEETFTHSHLSWLSTILASSIYYDP